MSLYQYLTLTCTYSSDYVPGGILCLVFVEVILRVALLFELIKVL